MTALQKDNIPEEELKERLRQFSHTLSEACGDLRLVQQWILPSQLRVLNDRETYIGDESELLSASAALGRFLKNAWRFGRAADAYAGRESKETGLLKRFNLRSRQDGKGIMTRFDMGVLSDLFDALKSIHEKSITPTVYGVKAPLYVLLFLRQNAEALRQFAGLDDPDPGIKDKWKREIKEMEAMRGIMPLPENGAPDAHP